MNLKIAAGIYLLALAMIFIIQNMAVVEVRFLFWSAEMSRAALMVILLSAGVVIGWLLAGLFLMKKKQNGSGKTGRKAN